MGRFNGFGSYIKRLPEKKGILDIGIRGYDGYWDSNWINGNGTLYYANGDQESGEFIKYKGQSGRFEYLYASGKAERRIY